LKIPFTAEQFFDVFGTYNTEIWPAQVPAYILGLIAIALVFRENDLPSRLICGVLAIFWVWMGIFYHIIYFSVINHAALIFGILFVLQGLLFLITGTILGRLRFRFEFNSFKIVGACFILYSMVIYPIIGIGFGHSYPRAPMFGVAPCPTTIFTFGILLWIKTKINWYLIIIPFIWALVGTSAAINLQVSQDYGLGIAGVLGTFMIIIYNRKVKGPAQESR
jgi:hypothetical protein